jgi:hypothetical protein
VVSEKGDPVRDRSENDRLRQIFEWDQDPAGRYGCHKYPLASAVVNVEMTDPRFSPTELTVDPGAV